LWHLYGSRQALTLRSNDAGPGTVVEVRLPFRDVGFETLAEDTASPVSFAAAGYAQ
jgi:hypothetical protein